VAESVGKTGAERAGRDPVLLGEAAAEMGWIIEPSLAGGLLHKPGLLERGGTARQLLCGEPRPRRHLEPVQEEAAQMPLADAAVPRQRPHPPASALGARLPIGDVVQPASPDRFSVQML